MAPRPVEPEASGTPASPSNRELDQEELRSVRNRSMHWQAEARAGSWFSLSDRVMLENIRIDFRMRSREVGGDHGRQEDLPPQEWSSSSKPTLAVGRGAGLRREWPWQEDPSGARLHPARVAVSCAPRAGSGWHSR